MDLAGVQRLTCSLPTISRLHSNTAQFKTKSCGHHLFVWMGWSVSDRHQFVWTGFSPATVPSRRPFSLQLDYVT